MAKKNKLNLEKNTLLNGDFPPVRYACYSLVKLPSDNDKKIELVHLYKGREILFESNHDGWYHRALLKDTEADYYTIEWIDNRLERKGREETIQSPIRDLTELLVKIV